MTQATFETVLFIGLVWLFVSLFLPFVIVVINLYILINLLASFVFLMVWAFVVGDSQLVKD
jgi:hypothetical protein